MEAPIIYTPNAIPDPDTLFAKLSSNLTWEKREAPRQEYYCNDFPEPYVYGKGRGQRLYNPQPYTFEILFIRKIAEELAKAKFEVCFLNRYLNQKDQLGWHADDSPEMDDARPIGIVSLGVEREIWFRPKDSKGEATQKLKLGHGSLCVMSPGMQDTWQHRIPKASFECGERISLTFRGYVK
jgi:alkylated DNA repair dioxygenase AlkB